MYLTDRALESEMTQPRSQVRKDIWLNHKCKTSEMNVMYDELLGCPDRVHMGGWMKSQEYWKSLICLSIYPFIHSCNKCLFSTFPVPGGKHPYPCLAEGNPGFRRRKGLTPSHSAKAGRT